MLPQYWRLSEQKYRLQGVRCTLCGKVSLLDRPVCGAQPHVIRAACDVKPLTVARSTQRVPAYVGFTPLAPRTVLSLG
jgi:hypothetical protein